MSKIIYILSLGHSGSTLINLLLGAGRNAVSLGEVYGSLTQHNTVKGPCTCGKEAMDCPVWGPVYTRIKNENISSLEAFQELLMTLQQRYGPDVVVIDSSKTTAFLKTTVDKKVSDIYVLYLIKDVRNNCNSQINRSKKSPKKIKDGWKSFYKGIVLYNIISWFIKNREYKRFMLKNNIKFLQFGYEELCSYPQKTLKAICDYTGLAYDQKLLVPRNSEAHIIQGNRLRKDNKRLESIQFDDQWKSSRAITKNKLFFRPLIGFNEKNVYQNLKR